MRKKVLSFVLAAAMVSSVLAGCGGKDAATSGKAASNAGNSGKQAAEGKVLNVWSWNDEFQSRFNAYFSEVDHASDDKSVTYLKDGTEVHWIINPNQNGVYQQKLDEALMANGANQEKAAADDKIDIFLAETDYLIKYIDKNTNVAMPLKDLGIDPATELADQYQYTKDAASDADGVQRATTWQACPGLFVYRRSIAKDVFGTDDPDKVQEQVADWTKFEGAAKALKDKGYFMLSSICADTYRVFGNNVATPWVTKDAPDTVQVDENIINWIKQSRTFYDNDYTHKTSGQWVDDWNKDMAADSKVFGWFFPAWGVNFTIKPNTGDAGAGDWAVCNGPQAYNWGGSFIIGATGTDNPALVKKVMLELTATKDTLLKITADTLDYTNTISGMKDIAADDSKGGSDFLGGENPYKYFAPQAETIKMDKITPYDQGCCECLQNAMNDYFNGNTTFEQAKEAFATAIKERYPELTKVNWPASADDLK